MVPNPSPKTSLFLLITLVAAHGHSCDQLVQTEMSMYFHDFHDFAWGPNATLAMVAGIPTNRWSFFDFGTTFVTDDPITEALDLNSRQIGHDQGIYITSSLDGANTHVLFSIIFSTKEYNGSTLELQGRSVQVAPVREVSVVSGIGIFRFARGYATFETVYLDTSIGYSIERCNVTVKHYPKK